MSSLSIKVAANNADVAILGGSGFYSNSTGSYIGGTSGIGLQCSMGFSFVGVTIPVGSTINSATLALTLQASNAPSGSVLRIRCENADNPAVITSQADFTARTKTTAQTLWTIPSQGANTVLTTANFAASLQEVVNRGGFVGDKLNVFVEYHSTGQFSQIYVHDNGNSAYYPTINVDYTAPTVPEPIDTLTYYEAAAPENAIGIRCLFWDTPATSSPVTGFEVYKDNVLWLDITNPPDYEPNEDGFYYVPLTANGLETQGGTFKVRSRNVVGNSDFSADLVVPAITSGVSTHKRISNRLGIGL